MIDDLFVPTPPAGSTTKQIANAEFVASAIVSAIPPAWSTYTPTLTAGAGSITSTGTMTGRFTQIGKTVFVSIDVAITTNGAGSSFLVVGLPVAANGVVTLSGRELNITGKMLFAGSYFAASTTFMFYYDNSYPGTNGARYIIGGSYEVP